MPLSKKFFKQCRSIQSVTTLELIRSLICMKAHSCLVMRPLFPVGSIGETYAGDKNLLIERIVTLHTEVMRICNELLP